MSFGWLNRGCTRLMVLTGAGMYAGGAILSLIESLVPGRSRVSIAPCLIALSISVLLLLFGERASKQTLSLLGPLGVGLVAYALDHTRRSADGAVLYVWPMLWTAHFFTRRATAMAVITLCTAGALALDASPTGGGDASAWIEVIVSLAVVTIVVRALTENNERLLRRLADEARTDLLTGLLNRRGLRERAAIEFARAEREQSPVSLIAFDIDHFKLINDEHGHQTGDQVLELIGSMLRDQIRSSDIAARVGGEEFVIVLPGSSETEALAAAERARLLAPLIAGAVVPKVTLSAGVASAGERPDLQLLTADADRALYQAKEQGRNRTVVASHEGHAESAVSQAAHVSTDPGDARERIASRYGLPSDRSRSVLSGFVPRRRVHHL
jgi:diguanylate cyclase (GGDEF)-like protein